MLISASAPARATSEEAFVSLKAALPQTQGFVLRGARAAGAFAAPDIGEVKDYAVECGHHPGDGSHFFLHYKASRWSGIKDWKAKFDQWAGAGWLPSQKQERTPVSQCRNGGGSNPRNFSGFNL